MQTLAAALEASSSSSEDRKSTIPDFPVVNGKSFTTLKNESDRVLCEPGNMLRVRTMLSAFRCQDENFYQNRLASDGLPNIPPNDVIKAGTVVMLLGAWETQAYNIKPSVMHNHQVILKVIQDEQVWFWRFSRINSWIKLTEWFEPLTT